MHGQKYKCGVCDKKFNSRSGRQYHAQTVHNGVRYFCAYCDKQFLCQKNLKSHVDHIHKGIKHMCDQCDYQSPNLKCLMKHIQDKHSKILHEKPKFRPRRKDEFICSYCGKNFKTGNGLRLHKLAEHEDASKHSCDICGKLFNHKSNLNTHIQWHHLGKIFSCDLCDFTAKQNKTLKKHTQTYHHKRPKQESKEKSSDKQLTDTTMGKEEKEPNLRKRIVKDNKYYKKYKSIKVGEMYKCQDCDLTFKTAMGSIYHRRSVHEEVKFDCLQCDKQFSQKSNLKTHIQSKHENLRRYECYLCEFSSKQNKTLKAHFKRLHKMRVEKKIELYRSEDVEVYVENSIEDTVLPEERIKNPTFIEEKIKLNTTQCNEIVDVPKRDNIIKDSKEEERKERVEGEIKQNNTRMNKTQEDDEFTEMDLPNYQDMNPKIEKENTTVNLVQDELKTKMEVAHFNDTDLSQLLDVTLIEDDTKFSVEEMGQQQHTLESNDSKHVNENETAEEDIKWESNTHTNEKPKVFSCTVCFQIFVSKRNKIRHMQLKHPNDYEPEKKKIKNLACDSCDYVATKMHSLKDHKIFKHRDQVFYCDKCDYKANIKKYLQKHMMSKHGDIKFTCDICGKQFSQKGNLQTHIESIHGGTKHLCHHCDFTSSHKGNIIEHIKYMHTDIEYTMQCDQCDFQARSLSNLNRHIKSKHEGKRYPCDKCQKQFTQKGNLKTHIQSVHEEIRLSCTKCSYQATQKSNLNTHMRLKH